MRTIVIAGLALVFGARLTLWAKDRATAEDACARLEARLTRRETSLFIGNAVRREGGLFFLDDPLWRSPEGWAELPGRVWLEAGLAAPGLGSGRRLFVSGPARCRRPARNPSGDRKPLEWAVSSSGSRSWPSAEPLPFGARVREKFRGAVHSSLGPWPGLRALSLATWTGDGGALPEELSKLYREGGLLHVLALSGQHVAVLAVLLALFGRALVVAGARWYPRAAARVARLFRERLILSALLLALVSDGLAPLRRALVMVVGAHLLQRRRFHVGMLSLIAGSAAGLLLVDPGLLQSPSFCLSVAATALLTRVGAGGGSFSGYVFLAWAMPLLTAPLSAHYFAKLSFLAPLWNFALVGLWSVLWLPLGFLAPLLGLCFPSTLAPFAETAWTGFLDLNRRVSHLGPLAYGAVIRPWALEAALWETLLVICLLPWLRPKRMEWSSIP
jgi:predicted membrane metal-binding protein